MYYFVYKMINHVLVRQNLAKSAETGNRFNDHKYQNCGGQDGESKVTADLWISIRFCVCVKDFLVEFRETPVLRRLVYF